jgi:hypothetical protein
MLIGSIIQTSRYHRCTHQLGLLLVWWLAYAIYRRHTCVLNAITFYYCFVRFYYIQNQQSFSAKHTNSNTYNPSSMTPSGLNSVDRMLGASTWQVRTCSTSWSHKIEVLQTVLCQCTAVSVHCFSTQAISHNRSSSCCGRVHELSVCACSVHMLRDAHCALVNAALLLLLLYNLLIYMIIHMRDTHDHMLYYTIAAWQ